MEYAQEIAAALGDGARFIRLTLSSPRHAAALEWAKVVVRPVLISDRAMLQAVFQGKKKQAVRNLSHEEAQGFLDELLQMEFRSIHLQCGDGDLHIRISKKGKVLVSRGKPSAAGVPAPVSHDRVKEYPFPAERPNEFLETIGVMKNGRVMASMRDKFRQINQFVLLLSATRLVQTPEDRPIRIVDCGCGRAFLTFAAYHHLRSHLGHSATLTGVDADAGVIASARRLRDRLGFTDVQLKQSRILDHVPGEPPDAVLSLHACDTATDEAIAQGVKWGASLILSVPCCQHELHHAIDRKEFHAVLRHGILRERTADILTDAIRAAALRVMGYRAEVIEFISPGHTAKNLMIRAEKVRGARVAEAAKEYVSLRDFWGVRPCIEALLGESFEHALTRRQGEA